MINWIAERDPPSLILVQIASSRLHLQVVSVGQISGLYFTLSGHFDSLVICQH